MRDDSSTRVRVLLFDEEPGSTSRISDALGGEFEVLHSTTLGEATELLAKRPRHAVVIAASMDMAQNLALLEATRADCSHTGRVLVGQVLEGADLQRAINTTHIDHWVVRPVDLETLSGEVRRLAGDFIEERELRRLSHIHSNAPESRDGSLASKDRLTGLYNHRSFQERLREELSRARRYDHPLSVLYADLDNFASLNRGAGFRCGDEVLREVAGILRAQGETTARQSDIASRFGGQEFLVMLPETDKAGAAVKAERLREKISQTRFPGGVSITVSVGVATFPDDGLASSSLLVAAEKAVRSAKSSGRDRVTLAGDDEDESSLAIPNVHASRFPTFHDRMGDLVYALERDLTMSCLYVDLSRLRRIEREFGVAQHNQLMAQAAQILTGLQGAGLRRDDLLCRTDDADGFLCFVSPPRDESAASIPLGDLGGRIVEALEGSLSELMRGLTRDQPQVAVGSARVLNNPMMRSERLVHRLVEETKQAAALEWQRVSSKHKVELQDLILTRELETVYQPLVDLDTGDRFAFEALTRGPSHSDLKMPTTLFSVADAVDLTLELDRACFFRALENAEGCEPVHRLFVNLLPASFYDTHFIEKQVVSYLDRIGLTPANLVFEITERLAIENFSAFRQALSRYTDMGFGVAVDDVGTRHSNLEAVMALQPHFIKLSEILCRGVTGSTVKREMVGSLVRIAEAIDAVTVAEGIEDLDDLTTLRNLGVRFGQGYFLARPASSFPEVNGEALAAVHAMPQRFVVARGVSEELPLDETQPHRPVRGPGAARGRRETSNDSFDDEPTRTRGTVG